MAFNFNTARVRIEQIETGEIYASLYKSYASKPVGTVMLRNLEESPLAAQLTTFVPELMDGPTDHEILLRPKAVQEVPITAVLSDRVMAEEGDRPIQVEVAVSYQSQRLPRTEKRSSSGVFYAPGAVNWSLGLEQAAAFVTARDPVVDAVAHKAVMSVDAASRDAFAGRNIQYAAAIFGALELMGLTYVPDPHNPYSTISETPHAIDTVHYPRETLAKRAGDCDDTSVLMAALLANVGVRCQFVDVPGHVFLLIDSDIHERNHLRLGLNEDLYVVADERVWIPLETTAQGKGFAEAWLIGADGCRNWASRDRLRFVDIPSAQTSFAPSEPRGDDLVVPELDEEAIRQSVERAADIVNGWRAAHIKARYGGIEEVN
jgi:hypothetical protein